MQVQSYEVQIVGNETFMGINSIIKNKVVVGDKVMLGMGAIVTKDLPSNVVAFGSPAKVIRKNE